MASLVACRLPGFAQKVIYAPRRIAGWSSSLCSVAACNLSWSVHCTLTVSLYSLLHATHCATEQSTVVHRTAPMEMSCELQANVNCVC